MNWIKIDNHDSGISDIKCGTIIKDDEGNIHLVGDLNELLGYCDCCNIKYGVNYYSNDFVDKIEEIKKQVD